jgi:hypothetical protein
MDSLDSLQIALQQQDLFWINICLAFLMYGVALDISMSDFTVLFKQPKPVVVGLLAQLLGLPALTLGLIYLLKPDPGIALGMLLVASCPGGNVSNFLVHLANGNRALSVSLTSVSTLISFRIYAGQPLVLGVSVSTDGVVVASVSYIDIRAFTYINAIDTHSSGFGYSDEPDFQRKDGRCQEMDPKPFGYFIPRPGCRGLGRERKASGGIRPSGISTRISAQCPCHYCRLGIESPGGAECPGPAHHCHRNRNSKFRIGTHYYSQFLRRHGIHAPGSGLVGRLASYFRFSPGRLVELSTG